MFCAGSVVVVQRRLDAGPRGGCDREERCARLRLEGGDRGGVHVVHRAGTHSTDIDTTDIPFPFYIL